METNETKHKTGGWRRGLLSAARIVIFSYGGLILLMAGCQRHFIYYPAGESFQNLAEQAETDGFEPWTHPQTGEVIGWRPETENDGWRVVVFHGNAGYALHRTMYAYAFEEVEEDWEVFLFEYPGYGSREGRPSEEAFFRTADEALRLLWEENDRPVFLLGESLGSGVATEMARRYPDRIVGLLLLTPFTRLADVGQRHFPFLPVRLLLRERFDNAAALEEYSGPIAVLLAEHDEVVPADLGRELYGGYDGPKKLWIQEGRDHNTLDLSPGAQWWRELSAFLRENAPGSE